ncbi:hypothetical protein HZS_400 [Henneguya salminicola]|nr:hypothetical protein HZS_400 [Henneguya salminicola]
MTEQYDMPESCNIECEHVQLKYSPDTSLLLSLGMGENMNSTYKEEKQLLETSKQDANSAISNEKIPKTYITSKYELPSTLQPCDDSWSQQILQNISYTIDPNQINLISIGGDQVIGQHNLFYGQNFNPLPIPPQLDHVNSAMDSSFNQLGLTFFPNQNLYRQISGGQPNIEECAPNGLNGVQMMPMNFNMNTFSVSGQTISHHTTPDMVSNIYVSKGVTKLSEAEDWTPNPNRLLDILAELEKLNEVISKLKDECDLPNAKPILKRERNRLASKFFYKHVG